MPQYFSTASITLASTTSSTLDSSTRSPTICEDSNGWMFPINEGHPNAVIFQSMLVLFLLLFTLQECCGRISRN